MEIKTIKRKPDFETESLRMWTSKGEEKEKMIEKTKDVGFMVKYKDMEIKMLGFTEIRDKKTKKIVFAYKIKHDKRIVLFYIKDKNNIKVKAVLECFEGNPFSYEIQDVDNVLKNIYNEKGTLENLNKNGRK